MQSQTSDTGSGRPPGRFVQRLVSVKPDEVAALLASFTMFFALLSAYYIIRPVRDEIGVSLRSSAFDLQHLFSIVFIVMLLAVPVFGAVAARFPRRRVLPAIYVFFTSCLVLFWILLKSGTGGTNTAAAFFVFASVFNLFVISLFWSLMTELWSNEEAKRLFGFISAGGTAGALAGPLLTKSLVSVLAPPDLLLVSAALLIAALAAGLLLRNVRPHASAAAAAPQGGGILDGALKVFASPFLARIALCVFIANIVGTFFYLEQSRLVGETIPDASARVAFF